MLSILLVLTSFASLILEEMGQYLPAAGASSSWAESSDQETNPERPDSSDLSDDAEESEMLWVPCPSQQQPS